MSHGGYCFAGNTRVFHRKLRERHGAQLAHDEFQLSMLARLTHGITLVIQISPTSYHVITRIATHQRVMPATIRIITSMETEKNNQNLIPQPLTSKECYFTLHYHFAMMSKDGVKSKCLCGFLYKSMRSFGCSN